MEQANSANFTIAALLGSARPQSEFAVRDDSAFQKNLDVGERGSVRCMMESDDEEDQQFRLPGKIMFWAILCPFRVKLRH